MGFLECIRLGIDRDAELSEELYSLILFGSYVRGDFVEGVSDLDFFAVVKGNDEVIPRLRAIIEGCTHEVYCILVDLPWAYLRELDDPMNKGFPFKFLTFYQEDFLRNHVVAYGSGIEETLPRYDWRELVGWRAQRLMAAPDRFRGDPHMLRVSAGEAIRLMALVKGAEGIGKDDVLRKLEVLCDGEALEVFKAYLEGRPLDHPEEYWAEFIRSRVRRALEAGSPPPG